MERALRGADELRAAVLAPSHGRVLEVGFGTGLNLPHYPSAVRSVAALDPMDALRKRVEHRIAAAPFPVERARHQADGRLPFDTGRFDCVVTTWTLCSLPNAVAALREMARVLRPGGLYLFLEHGLSDDPRTARWQRRLTPLQRLVGGGCRLDLAVDAAVHEAGFRIESLHHFLWAGKPRIGGEMYQGVARVGQA